jgi:hypothetical protein
MLTPSVGRGSIREAVEVGAFGAGLTLGGAVSGALAWVVGGLFSWLPAALAAVLVALAAVTGAMRDLHLVDFPLPQTRRQVPRSIFRRGFLPAAFQFGVELGMGWLTYITSSLPYVLLVAVAILHVPFPLAACAGIGFGLGRAGGIVLRLLDPDGEAWDRRMAAARWLAPAASLLGIAAVMIVLVRA